MITLKVFYDFNIQRYYANNEYLIAMLNYMRKSLKISKKQIQKDNHISHATFRRAEVTDFVGHNEILNTLAKYFNIDVNYDTKIIAEVNDNFNCFYTALYFGQLDKLELYYHKIEAKKALYSNSILFSVYHFARLIYYISSPLRVETETILDSLEVLRYFQEDLLEEFSFLLEEYTYCYYSLIHDEKQALSLAKKVYLEGHKYPRLLPLVLYQMSVNYYFINDYANSIFYSLEALPLLESDLNYTRAIFCHSNNSICFERLNNTVKSKEILEKIFLYLTINENKRLEFLARLTLANCYVTEENYLEAVELFKELESQNDVKGESSLMILFCYYKSGNIESFNLLKNELELSLNEDKFYKGYFDLVLFMDAIMKKDKKQISQRFSIAEKSFPYYSDSKIVELIYKEAKNKKII